MGRKYKSAEWYESEPINITTGTVKIGLATVDIGDSKTITVQGNVTLTDSKTSIGLVSLSGGTAWADPKAGIGLVSVFGGGIALTGNVTLDDGSKTAIVGNVTVEQGDNPWIVANDTYSYWYTSGPTTDAVVKGSAGYLHSIIVGDPVASGTIEVSDHASDGDGAVKVFLAGNASIFIGPGVYPINATFSTGITTDITNQNKVTIVYR